MDNTTTHHQPGFSLGNMLRYHFLQRKLNTPLGFIFMGILAILMAYLTAMVNYRIGPIVVGVIASIGFLIAFIKYPYFGFYFTIFFSAISMSLNRMIDFRWVYLIAPMSGLVFVSVLLQYDLRKEINKQFWRSPITISLLVLLAYALVELFNPEMKSQQGWLSYFRTQVMLFVFYVTAYCLFNSKKKIIQFIYFNICLGTVLALYTCKQQWFGLAGFEVSSIYRGGPEVYNLLYQGGFLRKFSTMADPATSGIVFATSALMCVILAIRETNWRNRILLFGAMFINFLGYSFTGTRTATIMFVAGIAIYCIATFYEKRTILFIGIGGLFAIFFMKAFKDNMVINRVKTAFDPADQSVSVRDYDRHQIQPYLFDHPMGGGIFTCGAEGPKYNPGHYLEDFQPDGGYAKMLAEQGCIGLGLLLGSYLIAMRVGIRTFYRTRDPMTQNIYIALVAVVFSILVAQMAQMAVSQFPVVFQFYAYLVILVKLATYDSTQLKPENNQTQ
jgi:putative inorganic carbon (hco3(-)) transporter